MTIFFPLFIFRREVSRHANFDLVTGHFLLQFDISPKVRSLNSLINILYKHQKSL